LTDMMINRRRVLAGAGAVTGTFALAAGLGLPSIAMATTRVTASALAGDAALIRQAFEALHPGLLRYNTADSMGRLFDLLASQWSRPQNLAEAYLGLSQFANAIRCGHTYGNFFNQTEAVQAELFAGATRLPFHFAWIERQMVVTDPKGVTGLARGDVIMAINRGSTAGLLRALLPYTRADGTAQGKRLAQLGVGGQAGYETFDIFQSLIQPISGALTLDVRKPDRRRVPVETATIDLAARRAQSEPVSNDVIPFSLTFPQAGKAVITMPTWGLYAGNRDWRGWIDRAMDQVIDAGAERLIVDLRGNEGGLDCGNAILARMIAADLPLAAYERRVRYRKTPDNLNGVLDTWDPSFRDWGDRAVDIGGGFYRLQNADGQARAPITPGGRRFAGRLIVLVDAVCSSATFQFANLVQTSGLGTIIGQPTGGSKRGINGSAFFFMRLPGSGLEIDLPLIGTFPATPQPDQGVVPDRMTQVTIADLIAGLDRPIALALA
jgi:hypothetical protein